LLDFVESRAQHDRLFFDFEYNRNGGYGVSVRSACSVARGVRSLASTKISGH